MDAEKRGWSCGILLWCILCCWLKSRHGMPVAAVESCVCILLWCVLFCWLKSRLVMPVAAVNGGDADAVSDDTDVEPRYGDSDFSTYDSESEWEEWDQ